MGARLYVGNLSPDTSESDLREAFSERGREVRSIRMVTDRATGPGRGFAFVELASDAAAEQAMAVLDGHDVRGTAMSVKEARDRPASSDRRQR
jgi:RNA recognition motif-containing protein